MKIKTYSFLLLLLLCCSKPAHGQSGFLMPPGMKQLDIPFEYVNNFIIVTLVFNRTIPIKMIFDTGAEHTILSKRELSDLLGVKYEREFRLKGADLKTELIAYLARNIRLEAQGLPFVAADEDILVLQEDYFRFEEYAGVNVHGILAAQTFSRYIFRINYQRRIITIYDRDEFVLPEAGFQQLPIEVFRNKIYLKTKADFRTDTTIGVKLLMDTGAALPLLFFSNTDPLIHPPPNAISSNIGMGLGGYLEGYIGRTPKMYLGNFQQQGVVTYFQELDTTLDLTYLNKRNGLVGNMFLNRFQVVVDYYESYIWLKPSRNYKQKYVFDRSGLNVIASGTTLNQFNVQSVIPNSPASEADIRPGDRIVRLGITPAGFLGLADIMHYFQKRPGKKVCLVLKRDGKRVKKRFRLRDLI